MPLDAQDKILFEETNTHFDHLIEGPIRQAAIALAQAIITNVPSGAGRANALSYLDSALLHAHAGIQHEKMKAKVTEDLGTPV
jgi:hypothetical protein